MNQPGERAVAARGRAVLTAAGHSPGSVETQRQRSDYLCAERGKGSARSSAPGKALGQINELAGRPALVDLWKLWWRVATTPEGPGATARGEEEQDGKIP